MHTQREPESATRCQTTVTPEIRELDALELWSRPSPGLVDVWVRGVILLACAITIAVAALGARTLWNLHAHIGVDRFWFRNGLAIGLGVVMVVITIPGSRLSRFARMAVALPIVQLVITVIAWRIWVAISPDLPVADEGPLLDRMPVIAVVPITVIVWLAGARLLVARRGRRKDWLTAMVVLGLANVLVVGLWLPIVARLCCRGNAFESWGRAIETLHAPARFTCLALIPPFLVALAFTAVVMRRPASVRRNRGWLAAAVFVLFVAAVIARFHAHDGVYLIYGNFTHVVMSAAVVAIGSLFALGVATWLRLRRSYRALWSGEQRYQTGVIAPDDGAKVVAYCEVTSWLRGPRTLMRSFTVTTPTGDVLVPSGAELVLPIPLVTTLLRVGEATVVLRVGDHVVVGGYVEQEGGHPFRGSSAAIPGGDGAFVSCTTEDSHGFTNIALTLWRPCVGYLVILIAVAIPGLVAALTAS